ncbi:isoleucine--tRNA ligase [Maritalea sp.]|uniref:isoleucine--tRNA ligase n=1 Tax=Maritalea sp. TaxID=2003361 RepID=UPI003EF5F806
MTDHQDNADAGQPAEKKDYSSTLNLPKTDFPMRAGLPKREPGWLKRWQDMDLYRELRETSKDKEKFTLHDGPPYANGNIHIGHALNKILKDIIVRSMQMQGFNAAYTPGWDCHGLPIEWKIEEKYRAKGKNKDEVPVNEFRKECREFADSWVDVQREEFKRLGVNGDWDDPYITMSYDAEAQIARELMKFSMSGQLYRGSKPVMWSVVERTALAEAEIEYHDYESDAIWVKFPVSAAGGTSAQEGLIEQLLDAAIAIWTTTPWTIPCNRAISYSSAISYGLYEVTEAPEDNWVNVGEKLVLADALAADVFAKGRVDAFNRIADVPADVLASVECEHPLAGHVDAYNHTTPLLDGEHVTDEAGTGFVHTAPGHGRDDFEIWMNNAIALEARGIDPSIPFCVDDGGYYTKDAPGFEGARIIDDKGKKGDANQKVITELAARSNMIARGRVKHSYPHSWRSKKPIIFRNTPQWFVYMDRDIGDEGDTLRSRALNAVDKTRFVPELGQNRLRKMVEGRPDWVLSRQRTWGVPICVFVNEDGEVLKDEAVNQRIADAFENEGADAWFEEFAAERFLGDDHDPAKWQKVTDILDVWFDSGSTHAFVLEKRADHAWPADVYLEGSDQHRGWFQSSLLEACGTRGVAPFKTVITNGFTMDKDGRKESKSLGNITAPQDLIKKFGADLVRLWVASIDYTQDVRVSDEAFKTTVDAYRKMRNTLRFLLGSLAHFDEAEKVDAADMPELEQYMLHRIAQLDKEVRDAYSNYDFKRVFSTLFNFMTADLSAFYFDIRKDALYCDPKSSVVRKSSLTLLDTLYDCLTAWLAPIMAFTMEEVWLERNPEDGSSVHKRQFPEIPASWLNDDLETKWQKIRKVRRVVTGALEIERREKRIGSSLESAPDIYIADADLYVALHGQDAAEIAITSQVNVLQNEGPADAFRLDDVPGVSVVPKKAQGNKCERSWKVLPEVGTDKDYPDVTLRDAQALRELAGA